jgi:hypothetical protein
MQWAVTAHGIERLDKFARSRRAAHPVPHKKGFTPFRFEGKLETEGSGELKLQPATGRSPRAEVCITVDTEFSIGGAFAAPSEHLPIAEDNVYCPAGGEDNGLPFIMRTLSRFGLPATFFLETLNRTYFGDKPIRDVGDYIREAGHDIQLHLHPSWLHFRHADWMDRLRTGPPDDRCSGRTLAEMTSIIEAGLEPFRSFGWPSPVALRAGGLAADRTVFQAMAAAGFRLGSNIGFGGRHHSRDPALQIQAGRHLIEGVLEIPILAFAQFANARLKRYRRLTITGVSTPEMVAVLWAARRAGVSPVVILTHPHEFVKTARPGRPGARPNHINKRRLIALCEFLATHPDDFVAVGFREAAPRWLAAEALSPPEISSPILPAFFSLAQNRANDLIKWI